MTKTLIKNEKAYRKFAFKILQKYEGSHIEEALGVHLNQDCWDYNDKDEPIDENGNVIPDETPETLELTDEIKNFKYPVLVLSVFDKDWDRGGDFEVCLVEFVFLSDFGKNN